MKPPAFSRKWRDDCQPCANSARTVGRRYGGISSSSGSSPAKRRRHTSAVPKATTKLTAYRLASTSGAAWREKNAAAMNTSTCNRAEHNENGIASIASRRERASEARACP